MSRSGCTYSVLTALALVWSFSSDGQVRAEGLLDDVIDGFVEATAPALQKAIESSRDDALSAGVHPIPPTIRQKLEGFVDGEILDVARYRVGGGGELSLQTNTFRLGAAGAITLDYVIVFAHEDDALHNDAGWVHELTHVRQYRDWGVRGFATRYIRSSSSVEQEAYDEEARYLAWTGRE